MKRLVTVLARFELCMTYICSTSLYDFNQNKIFILRYANSINAQAKKKKERNKGACLIYV